MTKETDQVSGATEHVRGDYWAVHQTSDLVHYYFVFKKIINSRRSKLEKEGTEKPSETGRE